jgi:hypothetical protein
MNKKTLLATAIILITLGINTGCASRIEYVSQPLPLPVRPILPPVTANDLECVSDTAYDALVNRETLLRHYAEDLETIISSTHVEFSND